MLFIEEYHSRGLGWGWDPTILTTPQWWQCCPTPNHTLSSQVLMLLDCFSTTDSGCGVPPGHLCHFPQIYNNFCGYILVTKRTGKKKKKLLLGLLAAIWWSFPLYRYVQIYPEERTGALERREGDCFCNFKNGCCYCSSGRKHLIRTNREFIKYLSNSTSFNIIKYLFEISNLHIW